MSTTLAAYILQYNVINFCIINFNTYNIYYTVTIPALCITNLLL